MKHHHSIDLNNCCSDIRKDNDCKVLLHDCIMNRIESDEKGVYFHFFNGFDIYTDAGIKRSKEAVVFLEGCSLRDIEFKHSRRFCFFHHYFELNTLLDPQKIPNWEFELIDEFYTSNQLFWKLEIHPKKHRLNSILEISASEYKNIIYFWIE